jgi:peptidyl-prolyl cis-trans isomerase A (cyclophilin A)
MRLYLTPMLLLGCLAAAGLAGCGNTDNPTQRPAEEAASSASRPGNRPAETAPANAPEKSPEKVAEPDKTGKQEQAAGGKKSANPAKKTIGVVIETSKGPIELELYPDEAPITVMNFLSYVKKGQYSGTIFHRVIPNFMIQGGGYTADLKEKPTGPPIKNEADNGLKNTRGTIAMARMSDPDSATAQFYINVRDNPNLDHTPASMGYAVLGKVTKGLDVVDKIRSVPTTGPEGRPMPDKPVENVVIRSVKLK